MTDMPVTLGARWTARVVLGMNIVHAMSNRGPFVRPAIEPTVAEFVQLLRRITDGTYAPSEASNAQTEPAAPILEPPAIDIGARYVLIVLNAATRRGNFVSVEAGGIAFEDPVWAILAAWALSQGTRVALPLARDNDELWQRSRIAVDAAGQRSFDPREFLAGIEGFLPPGAPPQFGLIQIDSAQLVELRRRGAQAVSDGGLPRLFELFQVP